MGRFQIEERIFFDKDVRDRILLKTNGKCAHCGMKISDKDHNYTIEHIVPLSKGGYNDEKNLLPLCKKCNVKKDNIIMDPRDYYHNLLPKYQDEALDVYQTYCEDVSWFSRHNYLREESISFVYEDPALTLLGHKNKNKGKKYFYAGQVYSKLYLTKTYPEDIDEIAEFLLKYNKKYGLSDDVKDILEDVYERGCVYKIHKGDNIIGLIPIEIGQIEVEGNIHYVFSIRGFPVLYQKPYYKPALCDMLHYIFMNLSYINDISAVPFSLELPKEDKYIQEVFRNYLPKAYGEINGDFITFITGVSITQKSGKSLVDINNYTLEDGFKIMSDAMQRRLYLPKLNSKEEKKDGKIKKNNKLKKEKRRFEKDMETDISNYI